MMVYVTSSEDNSSISHFSVNLGQSPTTSKLVDHEVPALVEEPRCSGDSHLTNSKPSKKGTTLLGIVMPKLIKNCNRSRSFDQTMGREFPFGEESSNDFGPNLLNDSISTSAKRDAMKLALQRELDKAQQHTRQPTDSSIGKHTKTSDSEGERSVSPNSLQSQTVDERPARKTLPKLRSKSFQPLVTTDCDSSVSSSPTSESILTQLPAKAPKKEHHLSFQDSPGHTATRERACSESVCVVLNSNSPQTDSSQDK
jgi:hypothetical protein